jgi:hypothetical protein
MARPVGDKAATKQGLGRREQLLCCFWSLGGHVVSSQAGYDCGHNKLMMRRGGTVTHTCAQQQQHCLPVEEAVLRGRFASLTKTPLF